MAGIDYSLEKLNGVPIPEDGLSFGTISASGVTPYLKIQNTIVSGSYSYETVTITLKGIEEPLFTQPLPTAVGQASFTFRGRTWRVINTQEGTKFNIAGQTRFSSWSVTGVDMNNPIFKI